MQHRDIAFIGAGNMSRSIISGMCASGYPSQKITASNPSLPKLDALKNDFSICITQQNAQAVAQAQVVVLAVKPQLMEQMCSELTKSCDITGKLFISIAAGIPIQRLSEMLAGHTNIIRTMPNTPSSLGKGMTGLYAPSHVAQSDKDYAGQLLSMVGEITWVETENLMNGVTAAAGSSPAYFYTFLEAKVLITKLPACWCNKPCWVRRKWFVTIPTLKLVSCAPKLCLKLALPLKRWSTCKITA
jgi:pyrroline-5-carboxylate reductase